MTRFIEKERHRFGVEPICRVLEAPVSTYYAHKTRPPSRRQVADAAMLEQVRETWRANYSCYGSRRLWLRLQRDGVEVGRDRVRRLMREHGLHGVVRGRKAPRTTTPDEKGARPGDLVDRCFNADHPNQLWVCDFTYCWTLDGVCYAAFILDVYSRKIVGWQLSHTMRTELVLDAVAWVGWYNHERLHSALDDRSPHEYEMISTDNTPMLSTR